MRQTWGSLLFMHWPIDREALRPLIPAQLDIDTHDGAAWIAVVPFTMWNIRRVGLPAIPGLRAFHELNVRTYVHHRGEPGVWFFSLEATKRIPVHVARSVYSLPYYLARITLDRSGDTIHYKSRRIHRQAPPAELQASWTVEHPLPESSPGELPFFLTERYCLFAHSRRGLLRARIHHNPWPLRIASLDNYNSTMIAALGAPEPTTEPLLHYAEGIDVRVWKPERLNAD